MFRQILIHPDDRDWLRIVFDFGNGLTHLRLCTVTYGTGPVPYQSLRVLRQIVTELCAQLLKLLRKLIEEQSYVDDFFGGADAPEQAIFIRDNLIHVLRSEKIELGKWLANDKSLLKGLSDFEMDDKSVELFEVTSTLGLKWSPVLDSFAFQVRDFKSGEKPATNFHIIS